VNKLSENPGVDESSATDGERPSRISAMNLSSIRWKILVIAFIATIAFAVYLAFNLIQFNYQASELEEIRDKRYPVEEKLQKAFFTLQLMQWKMEDAVVTGELETLVEAVELQQDFLHAIQLVASIDTTKTQQVDAVVDLFDEYFSSSHRLADGILRGEIDIFEASGQGVKNAALYAQVVGLLDTFKRQELKSFNAAIEAVTERANSIFTFGAPVGLITAVFLFLIAFFVSRQIIQRVRSMVTTLSTIASDDGDMSVRIPITGRDEMSELAFWFNRFIEKLERVTIESTREITRLAYTDTLTKLPNRRLFNRHLGTEISRCERHLESLAVMFLDLDDFKRVNDELGHEVGDILIREIADRLVTNLRGHDFIGQEYDTNLAEGEHMVARMGGDEFMLIIPDLGNVEDSCVIAERISSSVIQPVKLRDNTIEIGVSIGIAIYPDNGSTAEELTINADLAMYEAKARGKNTYCFFDSQLEVEARRNLELEKALHLAIDEDQFELHFQPKFSADTGSITGGEALLRWTSPTMGSVSPDDFVPLAEKSELICKIDHWVIESACKQISQWRAAGLVMIPIAVNISARQASRGDLVEKISAALARYDLPAHSIEVEITETAALSNIEVVAENIRALKACSVSVALDDFGAGHSSLTLLKYCDIDTLKIDRVFIAGLSSMNRDNSIIAGIIALARVLNIETVAEGVEQEFELDALREMGCDVIQGYLLGRPMPAAKFIELLNAETKVSQPHSEEDQMHAI
jgi:diguanylate cyclase (GGDEF)-like protein